MVISFLLLLLMMISVRKKIFTNVMGVKEYLIVYPVRQDAEVYILANSIFELQQKKQQKGIINLNTLPGLQIDLQKLFS